MVRYFMLIILWCLLTGCSLPEKPVDCLAMIKETRRAGCELQAVAQDDYLSKCSVVCK